MSARLGLQRVDHGRLQRTKVSRFLRRRGRREPIPTAGQRGLGGGDRAGASTGVCSRGWPRSPRRGSYPTRLVVREGGRWCVRLGAPQQPQHQPLPLTAASSAPAIRPQSGAGPQGGARGGRAQKTIVGPPQTGSPAIQSPSHPPKAPLSSARSRKGFPPPHCDPNSLRPSPSLVPVLPPGTSANFSSRNLRGKASSCCAPHPPPAPSPPAARKGSSKTNPGVPRSSPPRARVRQVTYRNPHKGWTAKGCGFFPPLLHTSASSAGPPRC